MQVMKSLNRLIPLGYADEQLFSQVVSPEAQLTRQLNRSMQSLLIEQA